MNYKFKITLNKVQKILPKNKKINIYVCGPTVYNHIHIGNARPLIVFDVLFRLLKFLGYDVEYVQNVTDIDDKIIAVAKEQNLSEKKISQKFLQEYNKICHSLNAFNFSQELVSKNLREIKNFIAKLLHQKYAYILTDGVYFDVKKVKNYGEHAKFSNTELITGEKNKTKIKKNEQDFALWKVTKEGLRWSSLWGKGRPGWHTECVAMIKKRFGYNLTIHGGGIDLKFPHHENEIAQFYGLCKKRLAKFWIYVGHVTMDNEKMSKSLGNFIYVKDLLLKHDANSLRWWFLSANPSLPIKYNEESFQESANEWERVIRTLYRAKSQVYLQKLKFQQTTEISQKAIEKLTDNLDLANFVTEIQQIVKEINLSIKSSNVTLIQQQTNILQNTLNLVGFKIKDIHTMKNIQLLMAWKRNLDHKKYVKADKIREKLLLLKLI